MKISLTSSILGISDQGQGQGMTSNFFPLITIQTVRSYFSDLAHGRKL